MILVIYDMPKDQDYKEKIMGYNNHSSLLQLFNSRRTPEMRAEWDDGKLFEHVILRAFQLESAEVTYPYGVYFHKEQIEQIDGAMRIGDLYMLVECKDYTDEKIKIEPLAKFRNQLLRRHASVFGMFFSNTNYTAPTEDLVKFMSPQMIILWTGDEIEYCLRKECFIDAFKLKYKMAVEQCEYNFKCDVVSIREEVNDEQ